MTKDYAAPDWRKLCEELTEHLSLLDEPPHELVCRAQEALAEPESEVVGPTDQELLGVAAQTIEPYDEIRLDEYEPENNCAIEVYGSELIAFARAVLGRWGRPDPAPAGERQAAPVPVAVSERLPGAELCWWFEADEDCGYGSNWTLLRIRGSATGYTHWLPANALPLPQGEVE